MLTRLTSLFPLWALLFAGLAVWQPAAFVDLKSWIAPLLGLVMFGMGLTLTPANFLAVLQRPGVIGLGVGLQYLLMPLIAWGLALALDMPPQLAAGFVLVGACPGGTASNVICYLARGDVALSISLTLASTVLAVLMTPLLTDWYAGQRVDVPVAKMFQSIAQIVLLPVTAGVLVNRFLGGYLHGLKRVAPLFSVASIVLIIAIVVALNAGNLEKLAGMLVIAVMLHNALGLLGGYGLARLTGCDVRTARTLAIETGMQNSGLAVALAAKYYAPVAALPGALFSVWHNLSGSLLASFWARKQDNENR